MTLKTCSKCGEAKPLAEFGMDRQKGDGRHSSCKECHNAFERQRARRQRKQITAILRALAELQPQADELAARAANFTGYDDVRSTLILSQAAVLRRVAALGMEDDSD